MTPSTLTPTPTAWDGRPVTDPTGARLGRIAGALLDEHGSARLLAVDVDGTEGGAMVRVAIPATAAADGPDDTVVVPYSGALVAGAPPFAGAELAAVRDHFGIVVEPGPTVAETTLSEERLELGTQTVATEKVLLRRRVVEEEVTVRVTIRREVLEVVRDRIEPPAPGAALEPVPDELGGEAVEIVLYGEEPVVDTRIVPLERVRLRRDVVTEDAVLTVPVRHEEVEVVRV